MKAAKVKYANLLKRELRNLYRYSYLILNEGAKTLHKRKSLISNHEGKLYIHIQRYKLTPYVPSCI